MPTLIPFAGRGHYLAATFVENSPVFVSADGYVLLPELDKHIMIGDGVASCCLSYGGDAVLTGGEDGVLNQVNGRGDVRQLADLGKKWLTCVASGPQGSFATASGRKIFSYDGKNSHEWQSSRTIEGLAFAPKGLRLGACHYNGVSLYWLGTQAVPDGAVPDGLEWKGAHHRLIFSPDGKFVVTAMQENALHGWRLSDGQHLRMSGYPAKVKNWSWSAKGRYLATSGAMAAIVWPFTTWL